MSTEKASSRAGPEETLFPYAGCWMIPFKVLEYQMEDANLDMLPLLKDLHMRGLRILVFSIESEGNIEWKPNSSHAGVQTFIDWASLSEEDFGIKVKECERDIPNFGPAMLCNEERNIFWERRNQIMKKVFKELSHAFKNVDLVSLLMQERALRRSSSDLTSNRTIGVEISKSKLNDEDDTNHIVWDKSHDTLRLKRWSRVAIDTQLFLYMTQAELPEKKAMAKCIENLFLLPFEYTVGAFVYTEASAVMLRERFELPALLTSSNVLTRSLAKAQLSKKKLREKNRKIRIAEIKRLFSFLDSLVLSPHDPGDRAAYEDLRMVEDYSLQAYDSLLVRQCSNEQCHVFLTHDAGILHKEAIVCTTREE